MNKGIVIKTGIVLVVFAVIHSIFWFFKTGQIEKQINNFISENSANVSAVEVKVSGFPLKQTVAISDLKFSLPNPALAKYQVTIKHLEASSGIFNNDFTVTALENVSVQDSEGSVNGTVEFSKDPEISAIVSAGSISKFSYKDFGHRVLDTEKNALYASSSTEISFENTLEEGDKIKNKILINLKDIENFDILSVYKNSYEKKVIEGIKTGEITIGNSTTTPASAPSDTTPAQNAAPATVTNSAPTAATTPEKAPEATATATEKKPEDISASLATNLVKNNFTLDLEYILTPVQTNAEASTPSDPTQVQETPVQYSKIFKINNLEFSNPLYKVLINGQIDSFQDDSLPSGSVTVKIEKPENLVNQISTGLTQISEKKTVQNPVQSSDLANVSNNAAAAPTADVSVANTPSADSVPTSVVDESYQNFLKRFSAGLDGVSKEVGAKNQLTKEDTLVFDVRREKNLDFLINETPMREILGKF